VFSKAVILESNYVSIAYALFFSVFTSNNLALSESKIGADRFSRCILAMLTFAIGTYNSFNLRVSTFVVNKLWDSLTWPILAA
jgi:hypothetical protein